MMHRVVLAAIISAFLGAAALVPHAVSAADEPAASIAKHAAHVGWHAGDGVVKTLRETGESTRDAKPRGGLTSLRFGIAHRDTFVTTDGLHYDEGFTGSVSWTSNENGFTVHPVGEVVRYLFDVDALFAETTATAASASSTAGIPPTSCSRGI